MYCEQHPQSPVRGAPLLKTDSASDNGKLCVHLLNTSSCINRRTHNGNLDFSQRFGI